MSFKGKAAHAVLVWKGFFSCRLDIDTRGAAFPVDGLTDE